MIPDNKWKAGDVVRLKTGGWPMTVSRIDSGGEAHCVWFERGGRLTSAAVMECSWSGPNWASFAQDALVAGEPLP